MVLTPPSSTRLLTIVAHVDHGKTTLADSLVESNGIISERHAGTLRYLDSLEEEQRRGITMRSSAIGLRHRYCPPRADPREVVVHLIDSPGHVDFSAEVTTSLLACDGALLVVDAVEGMCARTHSILREAYKAQLVPLLVVNKVDRLCTDLGLGCNEAYVRLRALVESVNAAAAAMVASARASESAEFEEGTEGSGDSEEAEKGGIDQDSVWGFDPAKGNVLFASALHGWGFSVPSLARSLFKAKAVPIKPPILRHYLFGDVRYRQEDGKVLKWKQDQHLYDDDVPVMFAKYALQPLWDAYGGVSEAAASIDPSARGPEATDSGECGMGGRISAESPGMDRVLAAIQAGSTSPDSIATGGGDDLLAVPASADELKRIIFKTGATSAESVLRALLRRYHPLSNAVLDAACEHCPDPSEASLSIRNRSLAINDYPSDFIDEQEESARVQVQQELLAIQESVKRCDPSSDAPTVAHVCKFIVTDRNSVTDSGLPSDLGQGDSTEPASIIMGLARVLSGTLRTDDVKYYALGPKHHPRASAVRKKVRLYLLMGSSFVKVDSIPAGHICAIYNLEDLQLKTVTLCDSPYGMPIRGFHHGLKPLVKVNVEPESASDTRALEKGLVKLSLADASVEVTATAKGERILACIGEIHLEQSIRDLETLYCGNGIKLRVSEPIVDFGESTACFENEITADFEQFFDDKSPPQRQTEIPPYCYEEGIKHAKRGRCRSLLSGRSAAISTRVIPLPSNVYQSLKAGSVVKGSEDDIRDIGRILGFCCTAEAGIILQQLLSSACKMDQHGNVMIESAGVRERRCIKGVLSDNGEVHLPLSTIEGRREENEGSSLTGYSQFMEVQNLIRGGGSVGDKSELCGDLSKEEREVDAAAAKMWQNEMRGSAEAGFHFAMSSGPFCEEPVRGVMVVLEAVEIALDAAALKSTKPVGGGMVVAALRSGIRCALLSRPARLVEGQLRLTLHSSFTGLGPLHAVLSKRRGKVLTDTMVDGTDLIRITASIPQAESFHLAPELLRESSGEVTAPELLFSHWELLEEDPFWIPTSLEEREDFGEILVSGDSSTGIKNIALRYIRKVRERKGLLSDSKKIVVAAEKQRTLKRDPIVGSGDSEEAEKGGIDQDSVWGFDPAKGNVLFASALHGWGFSVPSLARSLFKAKAVPIKPPILRHYLFGDVRYRQEDGKVLKWKQDQHLYDDDVPVMFAKYALQPLWDAYGGVSEAAASIDPSARGPEATDSGECGMGGRISAESPGMDRVLAAIQAGSTSPDSIATGGGDDLLAVPASADELKRIIFKTGATSAESVLRALLRRYHPLSNAVLDAACEHCPDPSEASLSIRNRSLAINDYPSDFIDEQEESARVQVQQELLAIQESVKRCDPSSDAPTVAHVCKFIVTDRNSVTDSGLPSDLGQGDSTEPASIIMGLARVLSGTLRTDDVKYYALGPKHHPRASAVRKKVRLYLLMGSSFVKVDSIPAGHICAIYNLEDLQLKTVTLCDSPYGMPIRGFHHGLKPLVKVNVEPESASDTRALEKGLVKLSLADASVEVTATAKGERILACIGEIHLEQSIRDLETLYCGNGIKLRVSEPIVDFGESTACFENEITADFEQFFDDKSPPQRQTEIPPYCYEEGIKHAKRGRCRSLLSGRSAAISTRVIPLPSNVYQSLKAGSVVKGSEDDIRDIGRILGFCCTAEAGIILQQLLSSACKMDQHGNVMIESAGVRERRCIKGVLSDNGEVHLPLSTIEGRREENEGSSLTGYSQFMEVQNLIRGGGSVGDKSELCGDLSKEEREVDAAAAKMWQNEMRGSAEAGFHFAMSSGPFCEEPVRGVMVVLEAVEIALDAAALKSTKPVGGGMVVAALRSGIRCALLSRPARLVEGQLRLTLHSSFTGLGPLHAVLSKRRGKVLTDTMVDGTDLIRITASIPQAESFHLAPELLRESSGEVTAPELLFSHWELLEEDPFWIPTSLEEREDFGEILVSGDSSTGIKNIALRYIRKVRERKGLLSDSKKIVVAAEKQRTLKRDPIVGSGDSEEAEKGGIDQDSVWGFDPAKGNVLFASALHGWGFSVPSLARSLFKAKAVPIKPPILRHYLFGDVRYRQEDGKVLKWKQDQHLYDDDVPVMFAKYALQPLWDAYGGVSEAAASIDPSARGPEATDSGECGMGGRISAESPGMDRVLAAIQAGSTSPDSIATGGGDDLLAVPASADELKRIIFKTGATSAESVLRALLRRYHPLSNAVLDAACEHCPDPSEASLSIRNRSLAINDYPSDFIDEQEESARVQVQQELLAIQESVKRCDPSSDAPTVAHVCKFIVTDRNSVTDSGLPSDLGQGDSTEPASIIMGLARVLSGTLRTDDVKYYALGPKHHPRASAVRKKVRLYLLMGSSFVKVDSIPAGHICAIYNLEDLQLKTVTLCDSPYGMPIRGFHHGLKPLVKVNVEPESASDTRALEKGLVKLSLADASVEVTATAKGERILACIGEIHLEQSIRDLETLYCGNGIKLRVSEPIVDFGESTACFENEITADFEQFFDDKSPPQRQTEIPPYCYEEGIKHAKRGRCRSLLSGRSAAISTRVIPLPSNVYQSLKAGSVVKGSEDDIRDIGRILGFCCTAEAGIILQQLLSSACKMDQHGNVMIESAGVRERRCIKGVLSDNGEVHLPLSTIEGRREENEGSSLTGYSQFMEVQNLIRGGGSVGDKSELCGDLSKEEREVDAAAAKMWQNEMRGSAEAGFHFAMSSGPFCEEPVRGVMVVLEAVEIALDAAALKSTKPVGGGMVVAALRSGIRCALLSRPARLVEGQLRLTLHSSFTGLGPLHAVLSKRRGKVLTDTMVDGTDLIRITASIPQAESFHLAPELLRESSGEVTAPELLFSHWELLEEDPFWIPTSLEEREDFGEILVSGDSSTGIKNIALRYIRKVRERKGLLSDSKKIVVAAEKQRTLKR